MQRIAILNMVIGFSLIFFAACGGAFVAVDMTQRFLEEASAARWSEVLQASSHGHTSLFGLIHIVFGLTLPYSVWKSKIKLMQTAALALGSLAMGPGMLVRAAFGPSPTFEWGGLTIGLMLSLALVGVLSHAVGLGLKLKARD